MEDAGARLLDPVRVAGRPPGQRRDSAEDDGGRDRDAEGAAGLLAGVDQTGGQPGWNQRWRAPLRAALDFLRDENVAPFEATRNELFTFPWVARDESISLILDATASREEFLFAQAGRWLPANDQTRALTYLELQRMLLLMYTSCGWFFNDISGIETIQILKYAARAIDLMDQLGLPQVRERFLEILAEAKSNRPEMGTGADIYLRFAESSNPRLQTEKAIK